jgi:hypothetical protein
MRCLPLIIIVLVSFLGCATPPRLATISELTTHPELYFDSTVSVSGVIKDAEYREGHYYNNTENVLCMTITDGTLDIYGYMAGYDKGRVQRAVRLAERAQKEKGWVTLTGRVVSFNPERFMFDSIQYDGDGILITRNPLNIYPGDPHYGHRWHFPNQIFRRHAHRGRCD